MLPAQAQDLRLRLRTERGRYAGIVKGITHMHDVEDLRVNVIRLCRGFIIALFAMAVLLGYWHVVRAPALRADPHNPRARERLKITQPGRILTSDGCVVLEGRKDHEVWYVEYPGREVYCHLTGYNSKTGLQAPLHDALYALGRYEDPWCRILRGRPSGCGIVLTINAEAQALATRLMAGQCGAAVAVEPHTGAIRVMVSAPAYDPTAVLLTSADYALFRNHPDKLEFNRALMGQYAPGSVFKMLTAAAALDQEIVEPTDKFRCSGQISIDGGTIRCRRSSGHGWITFTEAFTDSCNVTFAEVGRGLGPQVFREYAERFHLLERPRLPLPAKGGRMPQMAGPKADLQVAEAAFGQGAVLMSPIAIASLCATIANKGAAPRLRLIERITGAQGHVYQQATPKALGQAVSPAAAKALAGMMVETVEQGTGRRARIRGVKVAGKTGSAQNPSGLPHAWFAAFAPADSPSVAVAVIVENGGAGGEVAAPIARRIMEVLLNGTGG